MFQPNHELFYVKTYSIKKRLFHQMGRCLCRETGDMKKQGSVMPPKEDSTPPELKEIMR